MPWRAPMRSASLQSRAGHASECVKWHSVADMRVFGASPSAQVPILRHRPSWRWLRHATGNGFEDLVPPALKEDDFVCVGAAVIEVLHEEVGASQARFGLEEDVPEVVVGL
jgi:hypothetical protein